MAVRRTKPPLSVYLDPVLRSKVETIARERKRDISPQIELWIERAVESYERKQVEGTRRKSKLCRA